MRSAKRGHEQRAVSPLPATHQQKGRTRRFQRVTRLAAVLTAAVALGAYGLSATPAGAATRPVSNAAAAKAAAMAALRGIYAADPHGNDVHGSSDDQSTNWSGYADTGKNFNKVTSSWTEPAISCTSNELQLAAFWVGIDGFGSDTVEQDGTLAECYLGTAYYYTWWEMYPQVDIEVVGETVKPGDHIAASAVHSSGGKYTLKVTDSTTSGNNLTRVESCDGTCADTSDEVIGEAPSGERGPGIGEQKRDEQTGAEQERQNIFSRNLEILKAPNRQG